MRYLNNTTLLLFIMAITITLNLEIPDTNGASSKPPQKGFAPDELVVMFKDSATLADIEQIEKINQLELIDELEAEEKLFNMELRLYKAPENKPVNIVMDNLLKESRVRHVDYHVIIDSSKTDIDDESESLEDLHDNLPPADLKDSGVRKTITESDKEFLLNELTDAYIAEEKPSPEELVASLDETSSKRSAEIDYVPDEIIVSFDKKTSNKEIVEFAEKNGLQLKLEILPGLVYSALITDGTDVFSKGKELVLSQPNGFIAEPNYIVEALGQHQILPNDEHFPDQWGFHNTGQEQGVVDADIDAAEAWTIETGNSSVTIAVIDSGVNRSHPDFAGNIIQNSDMSDFVDLDNDPSDENGHGTAVSGVIGARANNSSDFAGLNWWVSILPVRVLDENGNFPNPNNGAAVLAGIVYATTHGADVINFSIAKPTSSSIERNLIAATGVLFVVAAGNSGKDLDNLGNKPPSYPALYNLPNIISVGASDRNDTLASFPNGGGSSNFGVQSVDLVAPGRDIYSFDFPGGHDAWSGTSFSAPMVTGTAGLMLAKNPALSWFTLKLIILQTVNQKNSFTGKVLTGGRLNTRNALLLTP